MAGHDDVKPNRTISHNLEDRLGATLDERLEARERARAAAGEAGAARREAPAALAAPAAEPERSGSAAEPGEVAAGRG